MSDLNPGHAAELAGDVYRVQTENQVGLFMMHPVFNRKSSSKPGKTVHLKAEVGGRVLLNHKDGFGICAEGGDGHKGEVFLIFRGTTMANKKADVLTDARIGIKRNAAGLPVHCGFDHCFSSMVPEIRKFLLGCKGARLVHCIGHSLGGAVASLAADWVARNTPFATRLYTFGAPRVGTDWFASSTTRAIGAGNMHRVYHRTDPVSMVPLYPFMQAPYQTTGHYLFSDEPLTSGAAHKMAKYIKSVRGNSWDQLSQSPEEPYTLETAIESWLKSKSPVDSSSAAFWRWVDSALIYVIKKVAMAAIVSLQGAFIAGFTVADRIAYILAKGISLAENISIWVVRLMHKLMEVLGMKPPKDKNGLSRSLIRHVLQRTAEESNRNARNAINKVD
ncbi:lipase family protein [Gilvimarinus sp. F26214L]|uniref:lipase family protein n=1 Tax=Gilvimarinus sp. DZF01 TaxID=3461371 RepID=UPI0040462271